MLPRRINLPDNRPSVYPSETINKVVSEETLPALTSAERHLAYSEINQAYFAVQAEIQMAQTRAELPKNDLSYRAIDYKWLGKAKRLRSALADLMWMLRKYEKDLPKRAIELEAEQKRNATLRRIRRQQHYIDAFTQLVAEKLGDKELGEMLVKCGHIADEWTEQDFSTEKPSLARRAMRY